MCKVLLKKMPHLKKKCPGTLSQTCVISPQRKQNTQTRILILEYKEGYLRVLTEFQAAEARVYHSHIFTMFLNVFAKLHHETYKKKGGGRDKEKHSQIHRNQKS